MSKWCVDCKYITTGVFDLICRRPIGGVSPVTGKGPVLGQTCERERANPTGCGPDGVYWEQRT